MDLVPGVCYVKDDSVSLADLRPQMAIVIQNVTGILASHGLYAMITSGNDSRHSLTSLHWSGAALDFRSHHIPREILDRVVRRIDRSLGLHFDVLLEQRDQENEHLHIEYQPRATG